MISTFSTASPPPETDLSELLLDYSDDLISYPDSDNDRYF